tara:strand:- start:210 stop:383 length:174 start_codon:yes stop_codon:yes gene_type:complete
MPHQIKKKMIGGKRHLPSDRYHKKPKPVSLQEEGYHHTNSHHIRKRETNRKSSERAY